jgi:hypothetical protein
MAHIGAVSLLAAAGSAKEWYTRGISITVLHAGTGHRRVLFQYHAQHPPPATVYTFFTSGSFQIAAA